MLERVQNITDGCLASQGGKASRESFTREALSGSPLSMDRLHTKSEEDLGYGKERERVMGRIELAPSRSATLTFLSEKRLLVGVGPLAAKGVVALLFLTFTATLDHSS